MPGEPNLDWSVPPYWKHPPGERAEKALGMFDAVHIQRYGIDDWKRRMQVQRVQHFRLAWFSRCSASGKILWPGQMFYRIIVSVPTLAGSIYRYAHLSESEYMMMKLRGDV